MIGCWLVGRFAHGRAAFERPRRIFAFAAAVVPGAAVAATVGVASLQLGGFAPRADAAAIWITWALGDITGALIVAPLLILWTADHRSLALHRRPIEALALLLAVVGVALIVFGGLAPAGWRQYPLAFLAIPPLLWAAVRFGRREAATAVVVLMAIAVSGTMRGFGAFAVLPPTHSLLVLQSFVATMALMTLVVAALVRSRERESDPAPDHHRPDSRDDHDVRGGHPRPAAESGVRAPHRLVHRGRARRGPDGALLPGPGLPRGGPRGTWIRCGRAGATSR